MNYNRVVSYAYRDDEVTVFDPEYFELKEKYELLRDTVLEYLAVSSMTHTPMEALEVQTRLIRLTEGE